MYASNQFWILIVTVWVTSYRAEVVWCHSIVCFRWAVCWRWDALVSAHWNCIPYYYGYSDIAGTCTLVMVTDVVLCVLLLKQMLPALRRIKMPGLKIIFMVYYQLLYSETLITITITVMSSQLMGERQAFFLCSFISQLWFSTNLLQYLKGCWDACHGKLPSLQKLHPTKFLQYESFLYQNGLYHGVQIPTHNFNFPQKCFLWSMPMKSKEAF